MSAIVGYLAEEATHQRAVETWVGEMVRRFPTLPEMAAEEAERAIAACDAFGRFERHRLKGRDQARRNLRRNLREAKRKPTAGMRTEATLRTFWASWHSAVYALTLDGHPGTRADAFAAAQAHQRSGDFETWLLRLAARAATSTTTH